MTEFASGGRAFALSEDGRLTRLVREERPVAPAQAAMLRLFLSRPGAQVAEAELARAAWGDAPAPDGAVASAIRAMQAALGDDPDAGLFIEALPQRGYRFWGGVAATVSAASSPPEVRPDRTEPTTPADLIRALCEARAAGDAEGALAEAAALGAQHALGPAYDRALQTLRRAAAASRGEPLPALPLETVIDGLHAVA